MSTYPRVRGPVALLLLYQVSFFQKEDPNHDAAADGDGAEQVGQAGYGNRSQCFQVGIFWGKIRMAEPMQPPITGPIIPPITGPIMELSDVS